MSQPMNLVVYLARAGLGSRRSCDDLVRDGAVTVNGEVVTFPRQKIAEGDVVAVNGEAVEPRELRYFLVNKPRGVASTRSDPHAERVIVDLVPNGRILFPVGRLDVETTGLIVLTNDGVLANRLMHPRYGVPKTYVARVRGKVSRRALASLRQGVELEDGLTSPAEVNLKKQSAKTALVEITIHEGRKRQVRRMFAAVSLPVEELHRRRYGPISDKGLEPGGFRELAGDEVDALRRASEEVAEAAGREVEGPPVLLAAEAPQAPPEPAGPEAASDAGEPGPGRDLAPEPASAGAEPEAEVATAFWTSEPEDEATTGTHDAELETGDGEAESGEAGAPAADVAPPAETGDESEAPEQRQASEQKPAPDEATPSPDAAPDDEPAPAEAGSGGAVPEAPGPE